MFALSISKKDGIKNNIHKLISIFVNLSYNLIKNYKMRVIEIE